MTRPYTDTDPCAERIQIELLRKASPARKLELLAQMNETVRALALSGLKQRHPQASEAELRRRLADLLLGAELAQRVYGALPKRN